MVSHHVSPAYEVSNVTVLAQSPLQQGVKAGELAAQLSRETVASQQDSGDPSEVPDPESGHFHMSGLLFTFEGCLCLENFFLGKRSSHYYSF